MTNIVSRAMGIAFKPKREWAEVAAEPATLQGLITSYAAPLAIAAAIASVIGSLLMTSMLAGMAGALGGLPMMGGAAVGLVGSIIGAVLGLAATLAILIVMTMIINALAPSFGAAQDQGQAAKVAVYGTTVLWLAALTMIIPPIGAIVGFVALIWNIFVIHWGVVACMKPPAEKAVGFSAVVIIIWCVIAIVVGFIISAVTAMFAVGAAATGASAFM